jgi:hypothetical protein
MASAVQYRAMNGMKSLLKNQPAILPLGQDISMSFSAQILFLPLPTRKVQSPL